MKKLVDFLASSLFMRYRYDYQGVAVSDVVDSKN